MSSIYILVTKIYKSFTFITSWRGNVLWGKWAVLNGGGKWKVLNGGGKCPLRLVPPLNVVVVVVIIVVVLLLALLVLLRLRIKMFNWSIVLSILIYT